METAFRLLAWTSVLGLGAIFAAYVIGSVFAP
jgi:hypothetical protein